MRCEALPHLLEMLVPTVRGKHHVGIEKGVRDIAVAVRRFMASYGIVFGSFDFAVTPDDDWVFFENNPAGTWSWVENRTGLPIAAAHADYLQGTTA